MGRRRYARLGLYSLMQFSPLSVSWIIARPVGSCKRQRPHQPRFHPNPEEAELNRRADVPSRPSVYPQCPRPCPSDHQQAKRHRCPRRRRVGREHRRARRQRLGLRPCHRHGVRSPLKRSSGLEVQHRRLYRVVNVLDTRFRVDWKKACRGRIRRCLFGTEISL